MRAEYRHVPACSLMFSDATQIDNNNFGFVIRRPGATRIEIIQITAGTTQ